MTRQHHRPSSDSPPPTKTIIISSPILLSPNPPLAEQGTSNTRASRPTHTGYHLSSTVDSPLRRDNSSIEANRKVLFPNLLNRCPRTTPGSIEFPARKRDGFSQKQMNDPVLVPSVLVKPEFSEQRANVYGVGNEQRL